MTKPKPSLIPRMSKGQGKLDKKLQEWLDKHNLRGVWKKPKPTKILTVFLFLTQSVSAATITVNISDENLRPRINFICERLDCSDKTEDEIVKKAIDYIIKQTTFKAWNLEDMGATVTITYDDDS